jgi:hypothetical protein
MILASALVALAFASTVSAQSRAALVGTWKLVSATDTTEKGETKDAYGRNPNGFLTYSADGRMIAIITNDGRKSLSIPDIVSAPTEERAEAYATVVAYAGTYTFSGDRVIHHVEVFWMQNMVNTDQVRFIEKLQGNRLTLRTPPFLRGGVQITEHLAWERIKSETK